MFWRDIMKKAKCKVKNVLKKTVKHLREDIGGYKENIKKGIGGKKEQKHEIKEDKDLIKEIKKTKPKRAYKKKPK